MVRDLSETILATQYILNTKPSFLTIRSDDEFMGEIYCQTKHSNSWEEKQGNK